MTPKERRAYDAHMDTIMVQNDVLDTARDEGRAEGRAESLAKVAANMIALGMDSEIICAATGLTYEEVEDIRNSSKSSTNN